MVRAPCCEKMGLKKGPWTPEEDKVLIDYIQSYGHGNWRALPKQAGLLRCGKSCRLRWINYLRPDLKRGNFSKEEEETIIRLHEALGNRWSAIAARLPGRTDNEIKNVWHTHLKKRIKQNPATPDTKRQSMKIAECNEHVEIDSNPLNLSTHQLFERPGYIPLSPQQQSSSDLSSSGTYSSIVSTGEYLNRPMKDDQGVDDDENVWWEELSAEKQANLEYSEANAADPQLPQQQSSSDLSSSGTYSSIVSTGEYLNRPMKDDQGVDDDENVWWEELSAEKQANLEYSEANAADPQLQFPSSSLVYRPHNDESMDFWLNLYMEAREWPELPEL